MEWLCTREDPHQSAQLEILGTSETFFGRFQRFWVCVFNFTIRETCCFSLPHAHPQEFIVSSHQASKVSWFPSTPRVRTDISPANIPPKSWNAGHMLHSSASLTKEKSWVGAFSQSWWAVPATARHPSHPFFSVALRHPNFVSSISTLGGAKQKLVPQAAL